MDKNLSKKGLRVVPNADRQTLIRRATFDLTGMPPTAAEVKTFVEDESPRAFESLIDRLLNSPAYGERWGRHWLDKARYADSDGYGDPSAMKTVLVQTRSKVIFLETSNLMLMTS